MSILIGKTKYHVGHICNIFVIHMPEKWHSVRIPERIHKALKEIVADEEVLYTNVSDLVKDALRTKIDDLKAQREKRVRGERR